MWPHIKAIFVFVMNIDRRRLAGGLLLAAVLAAAAAPAHAARRVPVQNINNAMPPGMKGQTLERIEALVIAAASSIGWTFRRLGLGPGLLEVTYRRKAHVAVADITFDRDNWAITYKSSEGLNAEGGLIHPTYNDWIRKLERTINARLGAVPS